MNLSSRLVRLLVFLAVLWNVVASPLSAQEPPLSWKKIEIPDDWEKEADAWVRSTAQQFQQFRQYLSDPTVPGDAQSPVILKARYSAKFDGKFQLTGQFDWQLHRLDERSGFITLGKSSLAATGLTAGNRELVHGVNPQGDWQLWCEDFQDAVNGSWSQWGAARLGSRVFDIQLPRSLSSRFELELPREWEARIAGTTPEIQSASQPENQLWVFDLGRQQSVPLRIEPSRTQEKPRILIRENSAYGLTTTDDLIRLRSEWECVVQNTRHAELKLSVPKPLRVFHVMLSGEIALPFERDLGSEVDQIRIPLRSLVPGQRISLQILAEVRRSADKAIVLPRILPVNAVIQEGTILVAVDRPLEIRSVEADGARPIQQTEEGGKELRRYELLRPDCRLSIHVGEPVPVLTGEVRFLADLRGEVPHARARVRMSTREGELYTPQVLVPAGWDPISVTLADSLDTAPAAWSTSRTESGDTVVGLELRQPIRSDRDCTVLIDLKSVRSSSKTGSLRLPAPRILNVQECSLQGVLWDQRPWELAEAFRSSAETDNDPPDAEFLLSMNWGDPAGSPAVPTGVRISEWRIGIDPQFQYPDVAAHEAETTGRDTSVVLSESLLSAHVELDTVTTRVSRAHIHRALFQFNRPARPGELSIGLAPEARPIRVTSHEREIPFVRQDSRLILDPAAAPLADFVLEYQTDATSGWVVARDPMSFPRIDCLVTEFVWRLNLDSQRRLYKLPLTAASTPQKQPAIWQRLLGPLSRSPGESIFNPMRWTQWRELLNGTNTMESGSQREELWFICPQIPSDFPMKTWNVAVTSELAWSCFLLWLAVGIAFRRARTSWFSRWWIYGGGLFLVLSIFVGEPYAPVAGGSFLGIVLAILIPRRFALGAGWATARTRQIATSAKPATIVIMVALWWCGSLIGDQVLSVREVEYFEIPQTSQSSSLVGFSANLKGEWDAWQALSSKPDWLLTRGEYQLEEGDGPPVISVSYRFLQFRSNSSPLRIPLEGVSLEQVAGQLDGEAVRIIPSTDGRGFLLPLLEATSNSAKFTEPKQRVVTLRFRPVSDVQSDRIVYTGKAPLLPESRLTLPRDWSVEFADLASQFSASQSSFAGFGGQFRLTKVTSEPAPSGNLADVVIRTLVECGPVGARVQTGIQPHISDPTKTAEVTLQFPQSLWIQSITGSSVRQSEIDYSDPRFISVRLSLAASQDDNPEPIEIVSFLAGNPSGFQLSTPVWSRGTDSALTSDSVSPRSMIGVVAKPGFVIQPSDVKGQAETVSPQAFSDSLFSGIAWQVPDAAWTCHPGEIIHWNAVPIESQGVGQFRQILTVDLPRSRWQLDGKIEVSQGVPFEHRFSLDPRLEIQRASVTQDGAERLFRWSVETDPASQKKVLILTIRDGQPGTQSIRLEGQWKTESGEWLPPLAEYQSGQTLDHAITLKHTSRVNSEIQGEETITRGDEQHDFQYRPLDLNTPRSIRVTPIQQERLARGWIHLQPREDHSWQVTFRAHLKDNLPSSRPIEIQWESPGLSDVRPGSRRDAVRILTEQKGLQWRPQSTSTRPAELTLSALWNPESGAALSWPHLTGVRWSESWISLPRGAGHRPTRRVATITSELPTSWPPHWAQEFRTSRLELFSSTQDSLEVEEYSDDSMPRPVWAESVVWMGQNTGTQESTETCLGTTKYLLISERSIGLTIPETLRSHVRAVSVQGKVQSIDQPIRLQAQPQDMSYEVVVYWQVTPENIPLVRDWFEFPSKHSCPHRWAVVPPYQQLVLSGQSRRAEHLANYWLSRADEVLRISTEFRGASWMVDGPLIHHLTQSRNELLALTELAAADLTRRDEIERRWKEFTQNGSRMISPVSPASPVPEIGLDAAIALCGESRSLWIPPQDSPTLSVPSLLDRRWALGITAGLAAFVSLGLLIWFVRLFRRLEIPERLAARPNATLIGVGVIWWLGLSPSVLGLALTGIGIVMWIRERWALQLSADSSQLRRSNAPNAGV